jgi:hypothetical protein
LRETIAALVEGGAEAGSVDREGAARASDAFGAGEELDLGASQPPPAHTIKEMHENAVSRRMAGCYTGRTALARRGVPTHNCGLVMPSPSENVPLLRAARHLQHVRYEIRGPLARRAEELERDGY